MTYQYGTDKYCGYWTEAYEIKQGLKVIHHCNCGFTTLSQVRKFFSSLGVCFSKVRYSIK